MLVAAALGLAAPIPSQAQDIGVFFNLMDQAIQLEQQNQRQKQERDFERQRRQEQLDREREKQIANIKRVQGGLAALGFYTKKIDGDFGPGTAAAVEAYLAAFDEMSFLAAFDGISSEFDRAALERLEDRAAAGWRSRDEEEFAQSGDFRDRSELTAARAGGFTTAASYRAARNAGFDNAETFAAFKDSGFVDAVQFERARKGGFTNPDEYERARQAGFSESAAYRAFVESGLATKEEYERAKAYLDRVASAADDCVTSGEEGAWIDALAACTIAAADAPSDTAVSHLLEKATAEVARTQAELHTRKQETEVELAALLGTDGSGTTARSPNSKIAALRSAIAETNAGLFLLEVAASESRCIAATVTKSWEAASESCTTATTLLQSPPDTVNADDVALALVRDLSARADQEVRLAAERAAVEAERLALDQVRGRAADALKEIDVFLADGGKFVEAIAIAKAVSALRATFPGEESAEVQNPLTALVALLESDEAFLAARQSRLDAAKRARAEAVAAAADALQRMHAFLNDFIAANVTFARMDDLLALQSSVETALTSGGPDQLLAMQSEGFAAIANLSLSDAYKSYRFVPDAERELELRRKDEESARALVAVQAAAARLIEEIAAYAAAGRKLSAPVDAAAAIARVRKASEANDVVALDTALADLDAVLDADKAFGAFRGDQEKREDIREVNAATIVRANAEAQLAFLEDRIANDVTSPNNGDLVEAFQKLKAALAGPDDAEVGGAEADASALFARLGLGPDFKAFGERRDAGDAPAIDKASNGLVVTAANAPLLTGPNDDLIALRNDTGKAPHVIRNLLGDIVFEGGDATACWFHPVPEATLAYRLAEYGLRQLGVARLTVSGACKSGELAGTDLVFLYRGRFLAGAVEPAQVLVNAFEDGSFKLLDQVTPGDVAERMGGYAEASKAIQEGIVSATMQGWGLIRVGDTGGGVICSAASADAEAHVRLIAAHDDDLELLLSGPPSLLAATSLERAFVDSKRGRCGAIYGDAGMLATVMTSLDAERIRYAVLPIWIEPAALTAAKEAIEADKRAARQAEEQKRDLQSEQLRIRDQQLLARQQALQDANRASATAAFKALEDVLSDLALGKGGAEASELFPSLASDLAEAQRAMWTVRDFDASLVDFGTARWDARRVEAVVARITISLENRTLGKYRDDCMVLGYLVDAEFNVQRDPFEFPCSEETEQLASWRMGSDFESLWLVQSE